MRGRRGLGVVLVVIGLVVGSCASTPPDAPPVAAPPEVAARRTLQRHVELRVAPAVAPSRSTSAPRRRPAAEPAPVWERFTGELRGPVFLVARARASAVPVSIVAGGPVVTSLSPRTRIGVPRVALVVAEQGDWLQVLLPLRPNSSLGWVPRAEVELTSTAFRVEIDRAAHRLRAYDAEAVIADEPVAVGRAATPTPAGQFYVTELLRPPNAEGAYGPFAFTLSAYSPVYQRFGSGDGAVGLHGTNEPHLLGGDVSHGCVRLGNDAITRLASLLPLGTPVVIR